MMGDYNINIMNYETHSLTGEFVDVMSSNSFMPLITRPTRVIATSATLIDNIFTNYFENLRLFSMYIGNWYIGPLSSFLD